MVSKGLGFQGERGGWGGDSYLLLSFLPVVGLCFIDCQSRGIIGIRKSLIEAVAKFYYDEPKSPVPTPPPPTATLKLWTMTRLSLGVLYFLCTKPTVSKLRVRKRRRRRRTQLLIQLVPLTRWSAKNTQWFLLYFPTRPKRTGNYPERNSCLWRWLAGELLVKWLEEWQRE